MIVTNVHDDLFEIIIPSAWSGMTVESIFKNIFNSPKKLTHQFRMDKAVFVNGIIANWTALLQTGDRMQLQLFTNKPFPITPVHSPIKIVYEDEHIVVVNKQAGIDTHPNDKNETNTLANAVAFYLQERDEYRHVRHVHRLDKDTTGAVIFSKHALAGAILDKMLEERTVQRTYVALVHGVMKKNAGIIDSPIGRDRHHPTRRRVSRTGQTARTEYKVIETLANKNLTLVQCKLLTGRTHQIRVHLSSISHPLVGDMLYGGKKLASRQALHAMKLQFFHPFTRELISCIAPFLDHPPIFPNVNLEELANMSI